MRAIKIYDRNDILEITWDDIKKYHGFGAYMAIGVAYRVVEEGLLELYGDEIPRREDISILSGHGGPGFRDVFEFVTRALTRGEYTIDVNYPKAQYDPYRAQAYAYVFSKKNGESVEVLLKDDFLPPVFYDYLVMDRENSWTEEAYAECQKLIRILGDRAYNMSREELLIVTRLS